ncbi:MAG: STT3 domain-containing protein [Candidatus Bathyarchaeia archaeon]
MGIKDLVTKENAINALKNLAKLRIRISHSSLMTITALILILFVAFGIRIFPLRWEIQTGALHLSEFDPYYQYSLTKYMVENGLISPYYPPPGWIDKQRWYPGGFPMYLSYPSLPMTAAVLYMIITALGANIPLMSFCSIFPALMGALACFIIYFLGKDFGGKPVGLLAALFLALSPSYIQRTSVGFFDDETIGIPALLIFAFTFLRAIEEDRPIKSTIKYSLASAAALAYFISGWGAAFYPIGLTALFVFALIVLRRYSTNLLLSYSLTFGLGLFIAINVPNVAPKYLLTPVILPIAGIFGLLVCCEILRALTSARSKVLFTIIILASIIGVFVALWQLGYMAGIAGKFISVINPFTRAESPLIESVAEHRITAWGSIYYEFGVGIIFFLISFYFLFRNLNNRNLFLLLFGLTSLYFACSMVRLLVLMSAAFSLLAAIGVLGLTKPFYTLLKEPPKIVSRKKFGLEIVGKEFSGTAIFLIFIILVTNLAFSPQAGGIPKVYKQAYAPITITAASLPIAPNEPVKEWFDMLEYTRYLGSSTVVCSWWDYGYWLSILGNVTSLADNATINTTQIENIGFIFMANETQALKMLKLYDAKYILVFTTLALTKSDSQVSAVWAGYGDEGKWMWMARISGKARTRFVSEGFLDEDSAWDDETKFGNYSENKWNWNDFGRSSTIYKLMSWARQLWCDKHGISGGDAETAIPPEYFEVEFIAGLELTPNDASSKYGGLIPLVCLYKVNYPP